MDLLIDYVTPDESGEFLGDFMEEVRREWIRRRAKAIETHWQNYKQENRRGRLKEALIFQDFVFEFMATVESGIRYDPVVKVYSSGVHDVANLERSRA
jgi:hypothetical protein